jgi:glycine cleavage system H protein
VNRSYLRNTYIQFC